MTKAKLYLAAAFVVTLVAGFAAGYTTGALGRHVRRDRPWLVYRLDMSPEQRDKLKPIMEAMEAGLGKSFESAKALRGERDTAISQLLSKDQALRYEIIEQVYQKKVDELAEERRDLIEQAMAKAKTVLSTQQWDEYQKLLSDGRQHGRPHAAGATPGAPGPGNPAPGAAAPAGAPAGGGESAPASPGNQSAPHGGA